MLLRIEFRAHLGVAIEALEFTLKNQPVSALEMPVSLALCG
jgi:hypothetical protein